MVFLVLRIALFPPPRQQKNPETPKSQPGPSFFFSFSPDGIG